jgi:hypothetical protein
LFFTSDGASLNLNGYGNSHHINTENSTVVDVDPLLDSEASVWAYNQYIQNNKSSILKKWDVSQCH